MKGTSSGTGVPRLHLPFSVTLFSPFLVSSLSLVFQKLFFNLGYLGIIFFISVETKNHNTYFFSTMVILYFQNDYSMMSVFSDFFSYIFFPLWLSVPFSYLSWNFLHYFSILNIRSLTTLLYRFSINIKFSHSCCYLKFRLLL